MAACCYATSFFVVIQASPSKGEYEFRKEQFGWSLVFMLLRPFLEAEQSYEVTRMRSCVLPARNLDGSWAGRGHVGRNHRNCNGLFRRCCAKATVNVVDTQTGLKRTVTMITQDNSELAGLSPATYDVRAQMPGFATEIEKALLSQSGRR